MNAAAVVEICRDMEENAVRSKAQNYLAMVGRLDVALRETREAMVAYGNAMPR
jgi:hypothetical protein